MHSLDRYSYLISMRIVQAYSNASPTVINKIYYALFKHISHQKLSKLFSIKDKSYVISTDMSLTQLILIHKNT